MALAEGKVDSHAHCASIMQGSFERAEPIGYTKSLFSAMMSQRRQFQ